jgi:uncharacterized membrane protein YkvA (DUF1232 family)
MNEIVSQRYIFFEILKDHINETSNQQHFCLPLYIAILDVIMNFDLNSFLDSYLYKFLEKKAKRILRKPLLLVHLLSQFKDYLLSFKDRNELKKEFSTQLFLIYRLLKAYASGSYRNIPLQVLLMSVIALLYLLMPFDILPDFFGFGLMDDMALIGVILQNYHNTLAEFQDWEDQNKFKIQIEDRI